MKKKKKKQKKILFVIACISLILICLLAIRIANQKEYYSINPRTNNIAKFNKEYEEVIGWLRVQGTNIDYPVIDLSKLGENEEPTYDYVWKNTSDVKLEDKVTIVGHNIRNVSNKPLITNKEHTRFEQLLSFIYHDFVKENEYIQYTVDGKNYLYKIYAVTFSNEESENDHLTFTSKKEKKQYIDQVRENSLFDYNIKVNEDDKLISLVTCTRMFGYENADVKFKVEGRLVREKENKKQYKVSISDNYDNILGGSLL